MYLQVHLMQIALLKGLNELVLKNYLISLPDLSLVINFFINKFNDQRSKRISHYFILSFLK